MKAVTQETVRCTDCAAKQTNRTLEHADGCPLVAAHDAASDDDAAWFAKYPLRKERRRVPTPAEQQYVEFSLGFRPYGVIVVAIAPGVRSRMFQGEVSA